MKAPTGKPNTSFKKKSSLSKFGQSENPFDKFANPRKKHEVLNRRVKGEDRDVGRAKKRVSDVPKVYYYASSYGIINLGCG